MTVGEKNISIGKILEGRQATLVPGAPNALFARIIEDIGFDAIYVTGAGIANMQLGAPDIGLTTLNEIAHNVTCIAEAVQIPLIVDADTGFGNTQNCYRSIRLLERSGASAIQLEDQVFPKKCGHFSKKAVVPTVEMVNKIKAAVDARLDPEMKIIARTDALGISGINEALDRASAFVEAGADATFVEAPKNLAELKAIPSSIQAPQVANMVFGGLTPEPGREALVSMGYSIVLYANAALQTAIQAVELTLSSLRDTGSLAECSDLLASFDKRQAVVQKEKWDEFERKHN
ncbi:isocitrate lyase/PEP mutase family protein [Candidatus Puniceispirillum sp.]|nr:isocitrate lyase/PEP mutase family protein [Candidatus Puniceispirillum sp.]